MMLELNGPIGKLREHLAYERNVLTGEIGNPPAPALEGERRESALARIAAYEKAIQVLVGFQALSCAIVPVWPKAIDTK